MHVNIHTAAVPDGTSTISNDALALVRGHFNPSKIACTAPSVERSRSVSSMRSSILPPVWREKAQLNNAVRAPPICR